MFGFLLGILFCIFILFIGALGASYGTQIAVDNTEKQGYFEAYGNKYKAVKIEVPNEQINQPAIRVESETK